MRRKGLLLSPEQTEHLFPFHLLINDKAELVSFGSSVSKLCWLKAGIPFSANFQVKRPRTESEGFDSLKSLAGQLVILEINNDTKHILRGQFEFNSRLNQLLFVGSPWFDSVEEVKRSGLTLNDFAYHDPQIDLLHVLKTKEIVNDDLKQLLSTVNRQKNELKVLSQIAQDNINGVIITDKYGVITWVNKSFIRLTGYSLADAVGRKPGHLLQGEKTDPKIVGYLRKQITEGKPFNTEILNYTKEGTHYWVRITGQPIYDSDGQLSGFFALEEDITGQKRAEEKLRINEEKYRNIIANMNLGLVEVDNNDSIVYVNQSFCNMSGYCLEELTGKNAAGIFLSGHNVGIIEFRKEQRKKGISDAYEIPVKNKAKQLRWWLVSGAPRYNDQGEIIGSIGIHLDITERKILEADLLEAKVQAEQLARVKETFLANMSHEIRTPMNAIMGMSNQLEKTKLSHQQQFYLETIHSASENLLVIINDILDLSKIEAGKLAIERIQFELKPVIGKAIQVMRLKAEEKGLNLICNLDPALASVLMGDPYRISQVLLNLLTNAVKFTEQGTVEVACKITEDHRDWQIVEISVVDTGIGMEESYLKNLFKKFSQENEAVTRKFGGTGLGMSICKYLVELMGGRIQASSKKGLGTAISFTLKLNKGQSSYAEDKEVKKEVTFKPGFLKGYNVLLVDDNQMNRLVASLILRNNKATIFQAENGALALCKLEEENIDIVLMDIQMPELDGYEATHILRQRGKTIPVIALTAEAIKGEREKCLAAGMNDYISKPFKEQDFLSVISRWIIERPKQPPGSPT